MKKDKTMREIFFLFVGGAVLAGLIAVTAFYFNN